MTWWLDSTPIKKASPTYSQPHDRLHLQLLCTVHQTSPLLTGRLENYKALVDRKRAFSRNWNARGYSNSWIGHPSLASRCASENGRSQSILSDTIDELLYPRAQARCIVIFSMQQTVGGIHQNYLFQWLVMPSDQRKRLCIFERSKNYRHSPANTIFSSSIAGWWSC